jgi:NADPH2:quinone reductase
MHAWICETWGSPSYLKQGRVPNPECEPGHVEITVQACGVNFGDLLMISGRYQVKPNLPFVPGCEVAGVVSTVGEGCESFRVGDHVAAYVKYGGYADRVVAPVAQVARIGDSIPPSTAAAFPVSYGSAELALDNAGLQSGETIVIGGAGGAVGSACVELAKQRRARVIASVGDAAKDQLARACGADETVSSRSKNLQEELRAVAPDGIDVIIDPVGGSFFDDSLRELRFGGRYVVLGFASGKIPTLRLNQLLVRHQSIIGSSFGLCCARQPEVIARNWPRLTGMLEQALIKPRISRTLSFNELPRALDLIKERKVAGRIVLSE